MRHVLVSGGTGVTGGALVRHLLQRKVQVTLLIRPQSPRRHFLPLDNPLLRLVECRLGEYAAAASRIDGQPEVFFHLAWGRQYPA